MSQKAPSRSCRLPDHGGRECAAWVAFDVARSLWKGERPEAGVVGMVLTTVSIFLMLWLGRAKRRTAAALGSRALEADAFRPWRAGGSPSSP